MSKNKLSYRTDNDDKFGERHKFTAFQRISQIILILILVLAVLMMFDGREAGALSLMGLGVSLMLLAHVELLTRIPPVSDIEQSINDIKYGVDDIKQSMDSDRHFKSND